MKWPYVVLAVALAMPALPARAGFYSGKDLLEACSVGQDSPAYFERNYECVAYVAGAVDAFNTTREANGLKSCIPGNVTIRQLRNATLDYLRANPKARAGSASTIVFTATRKAWPCNAAKKKRK